MDLQDRDIPRYMRGITASYIKHAPKAMSAITATVAGSTLLHLYESPETS